ncbi:MAG: hypothetical protein JXO51_10155 [Candidatus Aminicenantes bacterium]|nr:hypothetical protein [Candidatus Aminicenantes bacterium]
MSGMARWIKERQLTVYFAATYFFPWLLFLPYLLTGNEQAYGILLLVGIFCPAFAGILISRVISPAPDRAHRSRKRIAFLLTWALSTLIFTLNVHATSGIDSPAA